MTSETSTSSEYRIILGQDGDFDLFDLQTASPVIVTADPDAYDDDLRESVRELEPGNRINATLIETGDARDTGLFKSPVYRFSEVEVTEYTRSYHGFGDIPVISYAQNLIDKLLKSGAGIGRATITSDGASIGRVIVFNREHPSPAEPVFEKELKALREFGEPPFHVFQTATDDGRFFIHYYLVGDDSPVARAFLKRIEEGDDEWRDTKPPEEFRGDDE